MILPTLQTGGMETFAVHLSAKLQERGHHVGISTTDEYGSLVPLAERLGIETKFCRVSSRRGSFYSPELVDHLRTVQPDIVHSHTGAWTKSILAAVLSHIPARVHTIHGLHESGANAARVLESIADMFTDRVTFVSEALRPHFLRWMPRNGSRAEVIPNGVLEFSPLERSDARRQLGIPQNALTIGTIGRLAPVKNHRMLIRAFSDVVRDTKDAFLVIIGDGAEHDTLVAEIAELGIANSVLLTGNLAEARQYLKAFDTFCLPSISEGTSIALLESLLGGIPVVASNVGDNANVLDGLGLLIDPHSRSQLASALHESLYNNAWRLRFTEQAPTIVQVRFSMDACAVRYEQVYESVVRA